MLPTINPTETNSWTRLTAQFMNMQAMHLRELFHDDPQRFQKFTISLKIF